jgi:hypothetical protein
MYIGYNHIRQLDYYMNITLATNSEIGLIMSYLIELVLTKTYPEQYTSVPSILYEFIFIFTIYT